MSELFWLDITFLPGKASISWKNVSEALKNGMQKAGGNVTYCYKVIGEKHLIAVVEDGVRDGVEAGVDAVQRASGDQVIISCIPLRTYEKFASSILGLEEAMTPPSDHKLPDKGMFIWMKFLVGQTGFSRDDFLEVWKKEATTVMSVKNDMKANIDVFKEVGQNVIHVLVETASHDAVDDLYFSLPIIKLNGQNVQTSFRRIKRT